MAIVEVKNRDGNRAGSINTSDYVFNNCISAVGSYSFDKNIFPYVKIDNIYYVNDGDEFKCTVPNNCATMTHKLDAFTKKVKGTDSDYVQYFKEFSTFMNAFEKMNESKPKENELLKESTAFPGVSKIAVPYYYINDIKVNAWGYDEPSGKDEFFLGNRGINVSPLKFGFSPKFDYTWYQRSFTTLDETLVIKHSGDTLTIGASTYDCRPGKFFLLIYYRKPSDLSFPSSPNFETEVNYVYDSSANIENVYNDYLTGQLLPSNTTLKYWIELNSIGWKIRSFSNKSFTLQELFLNGNSSNPLTSKIKWTDFANNKIKRDDDLEVYDNMSFSGSLKYGTFKPFNHTYQLILTNRERLEFEDYFPSASIEIKNKKCEVVTHYLHDASDVHNTEMILTYKGSIKFDLPSCVNPNTSEEYWCGGTGNFDVTKSGRHKARFRWTRDWDFTVEKNDIYTSEAKTQYAIMIVRQLD